jgi:hypothetical protein
MAVNKVIYGGNTLVDLTGDTVTAADLAEGVKATGADGNPIVGLMQKVTIDAELSTTSTNPVQNKVIKAELDKKMAKTDKIYEANLEWGGRNIADGYSPIDAAMVSELGANRFMFGKVAGITVEYSEDAGATWNTYPLADYTKIDLFSTGNNYVFAGGEKSRQPSVNDMLRVTIDSDAFGVYTALNKFVLFISTGGASGCYCTIDAALESSPTTFKTFADKVPVSGWSGYDIINTEAFETYGNNPLRQYGLIRFTLGCTSAPTISNRAGLALLKIMAFGGAGWSTPSTMAKTGHLYSYNSRKEATFPATVTALNFNGKINGFTIETSVPANAKFTDTVYIHPSTHPASMITGLADVAKSGSYNDLSDKPTIPTKVSALQNDAGYLTQHQSLDGYAKTSGANTWTAEQSLNNVNITYERYTASSVIGTSATPTASTAVYTATGNFTLDLNSIASNLANGQTTVFTAYINATADYALSISVTGVVKYIGNASDLAITSAGLLLNILIANDSNGITSIVQASKLS